MNNEKTWCIDFGTGAGNYSIEGTVETAMESADRDAAYTQQSITIKADDGEAYIRRWWSVEYDPSETESTEDDIIDFGKLGYYEAWETWE